MSNFAPVDEQLTYLKKGAAEIIREADLRSKLEKSRATGKPLRVKLGTYCGSRCPLRMGQSGGSQLLALIEVASVATQKSSGEVICKIHNRYQSLSLT